MTDNKYGDVVGLQLHSFSTFSLHADEWLGSSYSHFNAGKRNLFT
jgi:hypothetical protein